MRLEVVSLQANHLQPHKDLQTMEIIEAVSSFEKIRTMLAQILVYRELISVWLIYKSYCGGRGGRGGHITAYHITVYYLYIAAQTLCFHHQA